MCQVHTGAYVSLLAPGKIDYTACHPRKTTTYILHVVSITTHTHDRRKSVEKKIKERKEREENETKRKKQEKRRKRQEKQEKTRQEEEARQGKKKKRKKENQHAKGPRLRYHITRPQNASTSLQQQLIPPRNNGKHRITQPPLAPMNFEQQATA